MTSKPRVYGLLRFRGRYLRDGRFGDEDNILTIVHELFTAVFASLLAHISRGDYGARSKTPGPSAVRLKNSCDRTHHHMSSESLEKRSGQPPCVRYSGGVRRSGRLPSPTVTPRCRLFLRCGCGWLRPPAEQKFCRRQFSRSWRPSRSRRRHLARRHPAARSRS